jgi:hypothetical protein
MRWVILVSEVETRLAEIRERVEKATPGEWVPRYNAHGDAFIDEDGCGAFALVATIGNFPEDYGRANCELLGHAKSDLVWLLDQLARVRTDTITEMTQHRIVHYDGQSLEAVCECGQLLGSVYGTTNTYAQLLAAHIRAVRGVSS